MPASPLTERSKIRPESSGGTPGPRSPTSMTTLVAGGADRTNVTVPSPCAREFSSSVARTCDNPLGLASPITDRLPSTLSCRPSRGEGRGPTPSPAGERCRPRQGYGGRYGSADASASSRSTTSASRSTWVSALRRLLLDRLHIVGDENLLEPHGECGHTQRYEASVANASAHLGHLSLGREQPGRPVRRCARAVVPPAVDLRDAGRLEGAAGVHREASFSALSSTRLGATPPLAPTRA